MKTIVLWVVVYNIVCEYGIYIYHCLFEKNYNGDIGTDSNVNSRGRMDNTTQAQSFSAQYKYILFVAVFVFGVVFDQVSKIWVIQNIRGPRTVVENVNILEKFGVSLETWTTLPREIEIIPGFFSLVNTQNTGAAFGIMQGQMWLFGVFTLVAFAVIAITLVQLPNNDRFQNIALALLTSGTVGNAIDRMHKQSVTDFLHVYSNNPSVEPLLIRVLGSNAWPSFNIADAAIVVGMIMFGIFYLFMQKDEDDQVTEAPKGMVDGI